MVGATAGAILVPLAAFALAWGPADGAAAEFTAGGLGFSDERGGFRIAAASGRGTRDDPIVIHEEITDLEPAVLVIRGLDRGGGATGGSIPMAVLVLRKVVVNRTARAWGAFELELRQRSDLPSDYYDGLSFDQIGSDNRRARADRFAAARDVPEPVDIVRFSGGSVGPGQTVTMTLTITDTSPEPVIYLIQVPQTPMAGREGSAIARAATGRPP